MIPYQNLKNLELQREKLVVVHVYFSVLAGRMEAELQLVALLPMVKLYLDGQWMMVHPIGSAQIHTLD